jgi:1-acyl-sn-glycerol-3-phosphate acyltransferase
MRALSRFLGLAVIRIYYRSLEVTGREHVPPGGPLIFVANHPNGLIDPLVVRLALGRSAAMLAKSTLFKNPIGRLAMHAFDAIPVYRPRDGEDTQQNNATFERCQALLAQGGCIAVFPEGTSHSDPELRPLKTGAARIALSAEAQSGGKLGVRVVPVGLLYENKDIFRSRVAVAFGPAIKIGGKIGGEIGGPIEAALARYAHDPRAAAVDLTGAIDAALSDVVLEAESQEVWRGLLAVAAWTQTGARDLAACDVRARRLAKAYRTLAQHDPAQAEEVVRATRAFVRVLRAIGIDDPLSLEPDAAQRPLDLLAGGLGLALLMPVACAGAVLGWLPYRLIRPLARRLAGTELDLISTYKVLLGLVIIGGTYLVEAALAAWSLGLAAGAATLLLAPLLGLGAVRFGERLELRRAALHALLLRATRERVTQAVTRRRRALCEQVEAALGSVESAPGSSASLPARAP